MAKIRPFRAIHPSPFYADQLVFTKPQVESVAGNTTIPEGLPPLKILLETGARQRPETPEGQALAYQDINETLADLLEYEHLWLDAAPCIYVYEVTSPACAQTGVWAVTALDDNIKTHELTFEDSVRRLKNYREHTGLEGSPILLTYAPDQSIDGIIAEVKHSDPQVRYDSIAGTHKLWKLEDKETLKALTNAFEKVGCVYLADGHHRKRSAKRLLAEQEQHNQPGFNTISALYMSTDELKISRYNRVVIPDLPINKEWLFKQLLPNFYMHESFNNKPVQPDAERRMGMYIEGAWFYLTAKPGTYFSDKAANILDVSILQDHILAPLFNIHDPGTDKRLAHVGGDKAIEEMGAIFRAHPYAIGFTLCPMTVTQLTKAADDGISLPPKSSWIDPKIPYGLLLFKHQQQ